MLLTYLGTAAAEGIPALFCNCETCKSSRAAGGKNVRTRSQTLINDDLLIDFGPDTYFHVCRNGLDLSKIKTLLITHAHDDHLLPSDLHYRNFGYAYINGDRSDPNANLPPLDLYITPASARYLYRDDEEDYEAVSIHEINFFQTYQSGKYTFIPLRANHAPGYDAVFYSLSDGEKTILYAHDTGFFPEDTVRFLKDAAPRFDFVSLDCTFMDNSGGQRHMSLSGNIETAQMLRDMGCIDERTILCCNHFSHNGARTHDEFAPIAAEHGFLTAYDGMTIEI